MRIHPSVLITADSLANNAELRRLGEKFVRTSLVGWARTLPLRIDGARISAPELHKRVGELDDETLAELSELLMERLGV